jgi:hypothetical protein
MIAVLTLMKDDTVVKDRIIAPSLDRLVRIAPR